MLAAFIFSYTQFYMRSIYTILLLLGSNVFMTLAWYGHLKWKSLSFLQSKSLIWIILMSWGIAFFEYLLMVPANRLGSRETGGNMDLFQLKILQEAISLVVFTVVVLFLFKGENLHWRHVTAFVLILIALYLVYKPNN
jgi:uncharacterized protein (DUF486 family)